MGSVNGEYGEIARKRLAASLRALADQVDIDEDQTYEWSNKSEYEMVYDRHSGRVIGKELKYETFHVKIIPSGRAFVLE